MQQPPDQEHSGPYRAARQPLVAVAQIDHHVSDMTATFAADVPLRVAQSRLQQHDQWLPVDGDPAATLGQLVEQNSTGPLRLGFGAWRDLLLGVQFTNGKGELITAGGRTMKNVAGYDLTKFMVGQHGVFGKFVTLTARTYKRPDGAVLARHGPDAQILGRLIPGALRPQWSVLTADALWCGYLGDETTLAYYRTALGPSQPMDVTSRTLEEDIAYRASLWKVPAENSFRASVPPSRVQQFVLEAGVTEWAADPAFGIVIGPLPQAPQDLSRLRAAAERFGGAVSSRGASPNGLFEFSTNPAERRIIERLKHAFDPDQRLHPLPWQTP